MGPFSTHAMVQVLAFKNTVPYCFSTEKSASVTTVIKHKLPESNDTHLTAVFSCRYFGNFIRVLGFFLRKNWEILHIFQLGKGPVIGPKIGVGKSLPLMTLTYFTARST